VKIRLSISGKINIVHSLLANCGTVWDYIKLPITIHAIWNNNVSAAELCRVFQRLIVSLVSLDASKRYVTRGNAHVTWSVPARALVSPWQSPRYLLLGLLVPTFVTGWDRKFIPRFSHFRTLGWMAAWCLHFNYPTFHSAPLLVFASFSRRRNVPQHRLDCFVWF